MFKVGDLITGKPRNDYSVTTDRALMLVTACNRREIRTQVLCHCNGSYVGDVNWVDDDNFVPCTMEEFCAKYPDCYKLDLDTMQKVIQQYSPAAKADPYVLSAEMRAELIEEMRTILERYHYHPTDLGLNKILDEWCQNKADLIRLFEKHPNYNGRFQIVFDHDYERVVDKQAVAAFSNWLASREVAELFRQEVQVGVYSYAELKGICTRLCNKIELFDYTDVRTINGRDRQSYEAEYDHFKRWKNKYSYNNKIYCTGSHAYDRARYNMLDRLDKVRMLLNSTEHIAQTLDSAATNFLKEQFPEIKAVEGQKYSRAIGKIMRLFGVDKSPNYNREFAKFADALNPLVIKRHTVISIHPVDYYTMSFGNSWSSCQTIDKRNDRGIDSDHNYHGSSSSGTESYMLDGTSCIFYTVDASYEGNQFELQDKVNRNMFHYYDNRLVQGRVYPQSNDKGANDLYTTIREIVQKVFADMLEVPNYWENKKGTGACDDAINTSGTHYCDYYNFNTCNVSTLKDGREVHLKIDVGHDPICPCCGYLHDRNGSIECEDCC